MASNTTLETAGGAQGLDWIEIYNGSENEVDFAGWLVTDDPTKAMTKWKAISGPAVVPAGGYLVVWCDTAFTAWDAQDAHAAVGLSTAGEAIALATPEGEIVSQYEFDQQFKDVSYGYTPDASKLVYFRNPTPGAANGADGLDGITPKVKYSIKRGYKTEPFDLELYCVKDPDAAIYYTLDGTSPTVEHGTRYTAPIRISKTTAIRAAVPNANSILQQDTSSTYIFVDEVLAASPDVVPEGFPANAQFNGQAMRYGMRTPTTLEETAHMLQGFTNSIATMSIVIDPAHLFNPVDGIYVNAYNDGREAERQTMIEQIDPVNGKDNEFAAPAGLRIRGAASRENGNAKHSFRLFFRSDYGMSKLEFPLFGDEGASSFDKVDLRCSQNFSIANSQNWCDTFVHEVFSRDSQGAMGEPYTRSRYYNLFINGVYWGVYQTQERAEQSFGETYNGGDKENYDVVRTSCDLVNSQRVYTTDVTEGTREAWSNLWDISMHEGYQSGTAAAANYNKVRGLNPDGTRNPAYPILLNPTNLIVYMTSTYYANDTDCPVKSGGAGNNVNAIRNRVDGEGERDGFLFMRHDCEWTFGGAQVSSGLPPETDPIESATYDGIGLEGDYYQHYYQFQPARLNAALMKNDEYKMTWSDLVYKHCLKKGGAMTAPLARARFESRMAEMVHPIANEMARWSIYPATSMSHLNWEDWCNNCLNFIDRRSPCLVKIYREKYGWYPSIDAPTASVTGGDELVDGDEVNVADTVSLANSDKGTVYYTLDGTDPRLEGGAVNSAAKVYSAPLALANGKVSLRARVRTSQGEWSAMECVELKGVSDSDEALSANLRFAEFCGLPATGDGDTDEWIVLTNLSSEATLDLEGVKVVIVKEADPIDAAKCSFVITGVKLAPGASVRLDQATWGWNKITNNKVCMYIYAPDGVSVIQYAYAAQKTFPTVYGAGGPGGGASLKATSFEPEIGAGDWVPSYTLPADADAAAAVTAAITANAKVGAWIDYVIRSDAAKQAELDAYTGSAAALVDAYIVNSDSFADPEAEVGFKSIDVDGNGQITLEGALYLGGVDTERTVNGVIEVLHWADISLEPEVTPLEGHAFPVTIKGASEGSCGFWSLRLR